jgi:hypothetical protein
MINKRVSELDDYETVAELSVYFGNDKAVLDNDAKKQIDQLVEVASSLHRVWTGSLVKQSAQVRVWSEAKPFKGSRGSNLLSQFALRSQFSGAPNDPHVN